LNLDGIHPDELASKLTETIVIKKFDGDDQTGDPIETIVIGAHDQGDTTCQSQPQE
jgi:hypothetical protein